MKYGTYTVEVFGSKGWYIVAENIATRPEAIERFTRECQQDDSPVRITKEGNPYAAK